MNLGELIVELCADTAQLEKSLEQAKKKAYEAAASIEKSFDKINLEINVDDDSLTDLNKHLNLKVQHLKEVNKYFNNNPIVVNVDDDQLVALNKHLHTKVQHLKEVNKYFNSNPIIAKVNIEDDGLTELQNKLNNLQQKKVSVSVQAKGDLKYSSTNTSFSDNTKNSSIIKELRALNSSIIALNSSVVSTNNYTLRTLDSIAQSVQSNKSSRLSSVTIISNTASDNNGNIVSELKGISSKLDSINNSINSGSNSVSSTSITSNSILQTVNSTANTINSSVKSVSSVANTINNSIKSVGGVAKDINNSIRTQTKQSSSGFFNGIFTNPIAVLGKSVNNIFTGFTEEIGRDLSISLVRPFNRQVIKKLKQGFKVFDDEIIGKEQVYETFLAELLKTGSFEKANYAAGKRTKIQKQLDRLGDLQVIANFEEESKLDKSIPKTTQAIDKILSQEPELKKQFETYAAKPSNLPLAEKKARFIPTILQNAQPTDLSNKVILPLIKEFQPLIKFIQNMQAHHISELAEGYYLDKKPAFPVLQPGQKVVSVIGGAEDKLGQGGRATATSLQPILGSNVKLLPVENLDTDATQRTKQVDNWIQKQIKRFAPDMLSSAPTITNAVRQIAYSLNPLGSDVAAAQALAHARLAKEQGNEASAISFSLGGASAYRYAKAAEYQGINTKTLAMAYPFLNLANATPKGFNAAILEKDPLTFPFKLGGYNPSKAMNILDDANIKFSGVDVHAIHHLFKSPKFVQKVNTTVGSNLPTDKASLGIMSDIQRITQQLHPTIVGISHAKDLASKGLYSMGLIEQLVDSKYNIDKLLNDNKMPDQVKNMAAKIREQSLEALTNLIENAEKTEFPTGKYKDLPSDDSHPGYQKYKQEIGIINKSIESFKTRTTLPGAYHAGGLNREQLMQQSQELSQQTIPWFKQSQQQRQFGDYGREIIKGFERILKLQEEFIRTHGNISPAFLDKIDYLPVTGLKTDITEKVKFPENIADPGIIRYINEVDGINASISSFKERTKRGDAWWAGNLDVATVSTRKRDLSVATIPWFEKQKQFGEYGIKIVDGFKTILKLQDEFIRTNGNISSEFLDKIEQLPVIPGGDIIPKYASDKNPEFQHLPKYFEEQIRLQTLPVSDAMKSKPATILGFNHMLKSLGSMMPDAKDIKSVGFGWSGAMALMSDKLVYKTDLNPLGKKKIASEQEVKAYERLQGRYAPLLYASNPGESMIVEKLEGRDLKRIMEEYAVPIRGLKEQQAKQREQNRPRIAELNLLRGNESDPEKRKKISQELRSIAKEEEALEKQIRESIKQFNDIFEQFYYSVGQLGGAIQKMGVVHNDLAGSNVFFKDFKIDPATNKVDIGKISSIDLGMSVALPTKQQKADDKLTTVTRALMDISLHGILDPIRIAKAISSGYKRPLPLPEKRSIDPSLLQPQNPAKEIPIGYTGKTLLEQLSGNFVEYKSSAPQQMPYAPNPDDLKDVTRDLWADIPTPKVSDDPWLDSNLVSNIVSNFEESSNSLANSFDSSALALNLASVKLENAALLLTKAVNSLNSIIANLKNSNLSALKPNNLQRKTSQPSNILDFDPISASTPEPIKKQLKAIQSGLIKGVDLSQRYKDATQAENNAAVPDLMQPSIIEQIKKESEISLNGIKAALDTINKIFSAEYKELAAEFEVSKKSGNLDTIKATKNKLRKFIGRSKEAITTIDKYVDIGRQAGFETSFNSELTSIKRKGKSGIRKNEKATDEKVGRLNYIEVELYNAKLTEQIALAEQQGVDIGKHINDGLKNGIKHNINGVSDEAKKMLNDLIATIKDTLDIQSPSKVMFDIGKNVITGLLFGFIDNLTVLKQVAKQIPNTVINTVEKGFEIQSPSLWGWRTGKNIGDTIGNSAVRSLFLANLRIAKMLDTIKEHEKGIRPYLVGSQVRLIETGQDNRLSERQKEKITDYLSNTKDILNRVLIDPISADPNEQIRELTANLQRARNILIQKVSDSVVSAIISIANNTSGQNTLFGTRYNKFAMQPGRAIRSLPASVDYRHNNAIRNRLFETQQQGQSSINYYNESIRARLREIEQPIRYTRRLPAAAAPIGLLPSSNIWDRPIDFSQVQQQRPTATSVPTIIPMLPPARTQRIAGYFGLSELDRRNKAVLDRRNARNRLRELQNQVEQTIDVDFEPVAPQPQQRTTPVTSRQSLPQLPSFLSSTRQQIPRSTISDILSFVISRTSQRTTSPQLPNLTQTATQQPQQPQSPSFTISGASRQSRPPQLPSFLSSTTQQIPQTQQPLSSPSFVISNVSPRNTSRSLQLPNFSQIGTQPSPSIQSTQQTATLPNVTQIAQPITQPVNFTPKYEKNWLVRLGIQMGRIVGEGFKTAFEMFGNKTFQALVKEVNKIKSAVENNTISLDAEAIRAGMSRGFKKGFNSIKGIKDIKKEFDTYIDFFQKVATPNVSSALGEGFGNNLVGMKELLIDFIDLPNKIKEGFNQAKLAVESFLQGFNKVPEIKKITDFLTNPKALGEAFGRNVVVVKKFIDSLQIPKNTIDGFKTAKAAVSDFLSGMNQIPEFKKLTDIFKDGTLRGKFSFDIGKGFGENLVKVKNFFDTLLIPKKFSDGLKEAKSLLSDFLSGLNAVPQIRKFVDSFKDQPSRFNKIANLGEGFGENIVKVKNFFDSLLIPKNFSEGLKEARMSLFVFLEGMKRVPEIKGFIDFLKSPMELGKAFGENIVNAKKFLDSLEAPTNLIDGFKKAKFALSDFLKGMKEVEGFGDVLKVLKGSISTIIGAIGLLFAGKFLLDFAPTFLKNSIDVASRMEVVGTSIKAVSTSTADAAKNMKEFSKQSNDLALDKFTFFEGAATFLGATKDTPLEGEVSRRMLNEFSVMVRARNLSKDQQQRALLALGQMASSGTIMTQDLKLQLAQAVPGAYQTFARSMGLNPQQLRKQLSLGNIQSEDLVKFTQQAYAENIGSLPNALDSYQAATDRLGNSLINVQQKVGDALLPIAKIFANIGSSLLNLIEFLIPRLVTLAIASILSITIKLLTIPGALTLVKFGITGLISGIGMLTKALISLGAIYVVTEIAVQLGKLVWILGTDLTGELGKQIDRQTKLIQEYRQLQSNQNTQPRERYEDNWQNRIWNSLPFVGDESKNIEAVKTLWNTFTKIQTAGRSNTKAINAQAEDLVSTGQFEDLNKIDAKIESTQAKQKAILQLDPGNFKDFNLMQKELDDLLLSRQVLITSIAPLQSNIAAEIETKKQIIDWLKQNKNNPILSENEAKAFNDELDFAKNQLIVLENLQNNLTKAISKSGTAYEIMQKQLRTVSFTLEDKKAQIEANKAQKLTGITSQVFTNKMTPGELKYQTDNLNVQSLQEGIRNITNSISGYRAVFQSFEATKVLDAFNITESTGISELEKTITLVEDEKSKYVLNQFLDFLKLKRSLVDANLQTSQAQQAAKQALIDQTKQVAEYYRTSVREAQAAGIEFEKARITLEGSKIQNRLRQALIGAGNNIYTQFVEGIINIITKSTEIEKRELDFRKQQIDYRNNLDNIKLRAAELQQNLPGKIIPFDEEKIKNFNNQLKIVNSSVSSTNSQTQKVVRNIGNDAVNATNSLNNSFVSVSKTIDKIGEKIDSLSVKLQSTPKLFVNPSVGSVDWFDPSLGLPQSQQIIPIAPEPARQLVPPVPPVPMSSIKLPSNIDPVQVASLPGVPIQIAQFQKLSRDPKRNFKGTGSFTSPSGQTPFATPMVTPKPMVKPGTKPKLVRPTKPMVKPGTKPKLVRSVAKPKLVRPVKPMVSPKPTGLSSQLMEMVKRFEGFNPKAYSDYNQYSIGYGTIAKSKNERISRAEASKRLSQELLDAQNQVKRLVKVPLNVNQLDALTSLTFNVGQGALKRSALLAKLNTGDYVAAANEFAKLNKADRVSKDVAKALTARRLKEKALFNTTPPPTAPIYRNTDGVDKPTIVEKAKPTVVEFVNPNVVTPAVTSNLRELDNAVLNRKYLPQDELQRRINEASELYGVTEAVKNVANASNYLAQANTDKLQQQLDLYRLIQQTTESIYQALSGIADLKLDNARTIIEGLSPDMSPMDRMELDAADYERSLQRKREGYEKNIRDAGDSLQNQNPVIKRLIDVELAKKFPNSVELRGYVSRLTDKTSQVNAMQLLANTEALRQLDANLPNMVQAFRNKREAEEVSRVFGLQMQDAKSALDVEQKRTEQLKVLQTLDPLNPEFNKIANRESIAALDNNKIQYSEKQQAIADLLRTKQISEEMAQQRLKLAEEEYFVVERTIKLRSPLEQINENTNFQNKLLERAQYLQDSSKVMLDARSALNKALGLDFRAEKIDKQLAITSQGFEFDKASIQLEDFIEKNKLASESNRLSNAQINELRENLRLMNEYKLDSIRLQFSELGFVFKNAASGFRSGFKEFLTSTKSFGESLTDLFNSIIKSILDSLADLASKRVTDGLFGWVAGLFGGNKSGDLLGGVFDVLSGSVFNASSVGFNPTPGLFDAIPTDFGVATLPIFASGGIVGALNKERSLTGRTPHLIVASEGERVLNHRETAIWNKLQSGVAGFANGGVVGAGGNGSIASRIGNTTTINVPVNVEVGGNSEVDTYRLSQAVQAMVSDGIRREMRVGGSINRGNPYGR